MGFEELARAQELRGRRFIAWLHCSVHVDNSSASFRSPNFDSLSLKVKEINIVGVGGKDLPKVINGS